MQSNAVLIPTVKPSSAIRTDYRAFSELVHESNEPIIVTNNGEADLVVMSPDAYNMREVRLDIERKLLEGDRAIIAGDLVDHEEFFTRLRARADEVIAQND
jgi:PHD/YefM family antitoxin component YafN of YafNO toxin-antitoxin module